MTLTRVPGKKNDHRITLYALSTCGWCRKTRELLESLKVEYDFIYVDQTAGADRTEVMEKVRELNPRGSYPTIKIDDEIVTGFDEQRISELLAT